MFEPLTLARIATALETEIAGKPTDAEIEVAIPRGGVGTRFPCRLAVTRQPLEDGRIALICSEIASNKGPSVTNAWPELATGLMELLDIAPREAVFVEHYGPQSYARAGAMEDRFDLVRIDSGVGRGNGVKWRRLFVEEAA